MKHTNIKEIRSILKGTVDCGAPSYPESMERYQDDTDGSRDDVHKLGLCQGPDGDMYVWSGSGKNMLRFRTYGGGGASLAVHNALRILAEAIKMDNENKPQKTE